MKVVIMAGGQGTRFWPWSVKERPKQFLSLMSEETMLQQTFHRFRKWLPPEKIYILTTEEYLPLVKEQLPSIKKNQILTEPMPRDTGPCLALAALHFLKKGDNEAFAAVPADHFLLDDHTFPEIFRLAEKIANNEHSIVTLGIRPTRPEPGYGYIQAGKQDESNHNVFAVNRFIEKPTIAKAEQLLENENIYWNSGIFIWKPTTIKHFMEKFQPDIWEKINNNVQDLKAQYALLPKISIDFAILEKADSIYTIPVNLPWDDVGNWGAWERLNKKTNEENLLHGDIHLLSTYNCTIKSDDKKVVVIGVEDLIIASTEEGLLVCHKSQEQKIKEVLNKIAQDEK